MPLWSGSGGGSGSVGPQGPEGPEGPQGPQGPAGNDGAQGIQGLIGPTGPEGPQGPQGPAGADGLQGEQGIQGIQGIQGVPGTNGTNGADGATGPAGADGIDGSDQWTYVPLANNFSVSTTAVAAVTGVSFTGLANTKYEVEIFGAFQSAATTTGIGLGLDIPSGSVIGHAWHNVSTTALSSNEAIADNAVTGATTGVRVINLNVPITGHFLVSLGVTGGTVQLVARSEIASSAVTLQGGLFYLKYRSI